jgi:hypothetical protein
LWHILTKFGRVKCRAYSVFSTKLAYSRNRFRIRFDAGLPASSAGGVKPGHGWGWSSSNFDSKGSGRGCSRWNDTSSIGIQLGFFGFSWELPSRVRHYAVQNLAADEILASVDVFSLSGLMISGGHVSADNYYPFLDFGL